MRVPLATGRNNKCAACHDMCSNANSSAFPHGNRGIVVYEKAHGGSWGSWVAGAFVPDASVTETTVVSGPLWMYSGDATHRNGSDVPTTTTPCTGYSARTVIRDAADFHDGQAGDMRDGGCLE